MRPVFSKDKRNLNLQEKLDYESGLVPIVSDLDIKFPWRSKELLPSFDKLTEEQKRTCCSYSKIIYQIVKNRGKLEQYGLIVRPPHSSKNIVRYINATLPDNSLSLSHRIGGVAHMLSIWCEVKS